MNVYNLEYGYVVQAVVAHEPSEQVGRTLHSPLGHLLGLQILESRLAYIFSVTRIGVTGIEVQVLVDITAYIFPVSRI